MILPLLLACGPQPPPPAPAPQTVEVLIDFGTLYGGLSSSGVVNHSLVEPGLLSRVQVEDASLDLFAEDTGVVSWTRALLLNAFTSQGSVVLGPGWSGEEGSTPEATAWLRNVRFVPGEESVEVVVGPPGDEGRVAISMRQSKDEASLCPAELTLPVAYVELHATLQRARDQALVAVWHELAVVKVEAELSGRFTLPDPALAPEAFCAGVVAVHQQAVLPEITGADFEGTGALALRMALAGLTSRELGLEALTGPPGDAPAPRP